MCVCVVVFGRCNCTTFAILHLSISNFINFYNFLIIRNILYVCNFFALYISMDERLSLSNWFSSILHREEKRAADFHERSFVFPGIPSSWKTSPTKQNSILPSQNWSSCHFSPFSNFDLSWDFPFLEPGFCEFKNCSPLCADIIPLYTWGYLYFFSYIVSHCVITFIMRFFYCSETTIENIQWKTFHLLLKIEINHREHWVHFRIFHESIQHSFFIVERNSQNEGRTFFQKRIATKWIRPKKRRFCDEIQRKIYFILMRKRAKKIELDETTSGFA